MEESAHSEKDEKKEMRSFEKKGKKVFSFSFLKYFSVVDRWHKTKKKKFFSTQFNHVVESGAQGLFFLLLWGATWACDITQVTNIFADQCLSQQRTRAANFVCR